MSDIKKVKMHCPVCNKTTAHEVRIENGEENCVCMKCDGIRKAGENAALRYRNSVETEKYETQRAIEAERMRTMSPGG